MANHMPTDQLTPDNYYGKILTGDYSEKLKTKVTDYIRRLQLMDELELPIILYLAAWDKGEKTIWYEFVGKRFTELMECDPPEISGAFRNSIIDRREYSYIDNYIHIEKKIVDKQELSGSRKKLRSETGEKGNTEAVYKLLFEEGRAVWLKDQASIESFQQDRIYLSIGCMTIISKEMETAEEKERVAEKLELLLKETGNRLFRK
jgi:hypothetical protein